MSCQWCAVGWGAAWLMEFAMIHQCWRAYLNPVAAGWTLKDTFWNGVMTWKLCRTASLGPLLWAPLGRWWPVALFSVWVWCQVREIKNDRSVFHYKSTEHILQAESSVLSSSAINPPPTPCPKNGYCHCKTLWCWYRGHRVKSRPASSCLCPSEKRPDI